MPAPLLQPDVREPVKELYRDLAHFFPELTHFYGYASSPDHNSRRCLDAMVYDSSSKYVTAQGRTNLGYTARISLGDRVAAFLIRNAAHYGINGFIWNRKVRGFPHAGGTNNYRGPYGEPRTYTLTAHDDHLHIDLDCHTFTPLRPIDWDGTSFPGASAFVLGASHPAVTVLGERLVVHGWTGYLDGPGPTFSETDRKAVAWFQGKQGWTGDDADGYPGPATWLLLMGDPPPPQPERPTVNIRVASWNTRRESYAPDNGTVRDWDASRKAKAKEFLADIDGGVPGVVFLQEATQEQQDDLALILGYVGIGNGRNGHPKDRNGDNVAVLLDEVAYHVQRVLSVSSGGVTPRFITLVKAERNGVSVWLGSTHLTAHTANAELRRTELRALLTNARNMGVDLASLILAGDFNEAAPATQTGARQVARELGLVDFITLLDDTQFPNKAVSTFTGWDPDVNEGHHIDAILIGANIQARAGRIAPVGNGASDHNMLIGNLTIQGATP